MRGSEGVAPNVSHQQLMAADEGDSDGVETVTVGSSSGRASLSSASPKGWRTVSLSEWCCVGVLCYVNLINYMDRYTMAGIIKDIQHEFDLQGSGSGLLQTVFVISYMIFAPIFGYLGDRYSRKAIMAFGVFLWSLTTLAGSYMQSWGWFLLLRACVGIGEASYSTIAPTIISDLFSKDLRAKMLALFYFAIPVGSGLGYIVGAKTAVATGQWQWALRVTPIMGALAVILILTVVRDPPRGHSDGHSQLAHTSWIEDLRYLIRNRSFMLSTVGFMCVTFVSGGLAWWGPIFIIRGVQLQPGNAHITDDDVSFQFGLVAVASGALGVPLGQWVASRLRPHYANADPLVCAGGLILSTIFVFAAILTPSHSTPATFALVFCGMLLLNLNWSIVADMLLYVVVPTRRSTAEAFQILISHAFGDAGSPFLIGCMADWLGGRINGLPDSVAFYSLQYTLFTTCFVEILGGAFFLITALYIVSDRLAADRSVKEMAVQSPCVGVDLPDARSHLLSSVKPTSIENDEPSNMFADEAQPSSRSASVSC